MHLQPVWHRVRSSELIASAVTPVRRRGLVYSVGLGGITCGYRCSGNRKGKDILACLLNYVLLFMYLGFLHAFIAMFILFAFLGISSE